MVRKIIKIDEVKCNGCGLCADACHEGAIQMIGGKAKLIKEHFCDGLGDCLPACPVGAISFEEREAPEYDEAAVLASKVGILSYVEIPEAGKPIRVLVEDGINVERLSSLANAKRPVPQMPTPPRNLENTERPMPQMPTPPGNLENVERPVPQMPTPPSNLENAESPMPQMPVPPCGLGSKIRQIPQMPQRPEHMKKAPDDYEINYKVPSRLTQWPVQIKLAPTEAPFYEKAHLLIAADCTAFAYGNFHEDYMKNRVTLIGCPKLDAVDYYEKLVEIIRNNNIKSVTVVRMTVPCCGGLENAVKRALQDSEKFMPWQVVVVSPEGNIVE